MSAVAQFFLSQGHEISGSDLASSKVTDLLIKKGARVFLNHQAENLPDDTGLVVYTTAVDPKNPELKKASDLNIRTISYAESLGLVSEGKFTIAVAGTHGKTTTTAMVAQIMIEAGLSPTVIAGSLMSEYGSNFVLGESDYLVVEACEYRRSFLHLAPNILVITNIDRDHLDYYKDLKDIQSAFAELARKLKPADFLVCNINDPNLEPIIEDKKVECNIIDYHTISGSLPRLQVPGKHNEENAKAALSVAAVLEIDQKKASESIKNFKGTWRRLENKGKSKKGVLIFDDYAHHPAEIKASLSSLFEMFPDKKIVIIFQPHLYSRTKLLLKEFGQSFNGVTEVITAPIYPAREVEDSTISSDILASEIRKSGVSAVSLKNFKEIAEYVNKNFESDSVIVTMGAGDIYEVVEILGK